MRIIILLTAKQVKRKGKPIAVFSPANPRAVVIPTQSGHIALV
jgi:hypothetical protein